MRCNHFLSTAILLLAAVAVSSTTAAETGGPRIGEASTCQRKVGVMVQAIGGPCRGIYATFPLPSHWPEQKVKLVSKVVSPHVTGLELRSLESGVEQALVSIAFLPANQQAHVIFTYELTTAEIQPPRDPSVFVVPRRVPRDIQPYLSTSPFINCRHSQIRSKVKDIVGDAESAWDQVEAIYNFVRDDIDNRDARLKGAVATLRDGHGDAEDLVNLFVALGRAHKVPARIVWVSGHFYPEFYLQDGDGDGHWLPCQIVGEREFGHISGRMPILQKGDNIKVPEKRERQRYVSEHLKGGGGRPRVTFVRENMAAE